MYGLHLKILESSAKKDLTVPLGNAEGPPNIQIAPNIFDVKISHHNALIIALEASPRVVIKVKVFDV